MNDWQPVPVQRKILESDVEQHLCSRVKALGGECLKWASQNVRGVPDRVCIFPGGEVWFIELKRDGAAKLSPLQRQFFAKMDRLNMTRCAVLHGKECVDGWIEAIQGRAHPC